MQSAVLFAHVVKGMVIKRFICGKGQIKTYKLLQKNVSLRSEVINIFNSPISHREEVANNVERFVRALYPISFKLTVLPPTKAAFYQHSLRTYLQVDPTVYVCMKRVIQEWRENELPPTDWVWHFYNSHDTLMPVITTLPPAPSFLMQNIACTCKRDCNARCSCRKESERCSDMCVHCHGTNCLNAASYELDTDKL
ncbi:hypothetical protein PR048_012831 [Dryococelus australis]|uniref:Uncharacterized protein n=1 Tax=Dryococelus australis TaxID=614101 RepID=A0ABQ9HQG9_9NEOP|nr:hypothetical protein PR048_012831 [Dryococelus australis]